MSLKVLVDKELIDRPTAFESGAERRRSEDGAQGHRRISAWNSLMLRISCCLICCVVGLVFGLLRLGHRRRPTPGRAYPLTTNAGPDRPRAGNYFSWIKLVTGDRSLPAMGQDNGLGQSRLPGPGIALCRLEPHHRAAVCCLSVSGADDSRVCGRLRLLMLGYIGPMAVYVVKRNSTVELHHRVLTPSHMRHPGWINWAKWALTWATKAKAAAPRRGTPVTFTALGGTEQQNQANIIRARQSVGFLPAKELVAEAIRQRADKCMLDFTRDAVAVRFQIDGVWHEAGGARPRVG